MRRFVHESLPARIVFGAGALAELPAEVERLDLRRALTLATPQQRESAERTAALLGGRSAGVFTEAEMHTPVDVTERAMEVVRERGVDGLVAVGGGSTTGLAKAIALRTDLPQIVAPTTYAGSEMTPILGETKDGVKTTIRDRKVLPEVVIYDVDLTLTLPRALSATSGLNAIAHAMEALYARDGDPIVSLKAEEGVRAFAVGAAAHRRRRSRPRGASGRALWRVAVRLVPRRRRHGAAPQAMSRARRLVRPPACRDACGHSAARGRLQRARRAGRDGAPGAGAGRRATRRAVCGSWPNASALLCRSANSA